MSIGDVKAQLFAAADFYEQASGKAVAVADEAQTATDMARMAFEGSGNQELLDTLGRADAMAIEISSVQIECMSLASRLRDIASTL